MSKLPKLPRGMGSMSQRADGTIEYKKVIGKYKKKRVTVYGASSKDCLAAMKKKEEAYLKDESRTSVYGISEELASPVLQEAMEEWLYTFKRQELGKDKSFDTIEGTFRNQIMDTELGTFEIRNIFPADVQRHLNRIIDEKSVSTTKKTYSLLKQFFAYYYHIDINHNPMNTVKMPQRREKFDIDDVTDDLFNDDVPVLSDDEIQKLTQELGKPPVSGKVGYKHGYALLFIMWSFIRYGEAVALQWKDINFSGAEMRIYKEYSKIKVRDGSGKATGGWKWVITEPKTRSGRRKEPLYAEAIDSLVKYRETTGYSDDPDRFIFVSENNTPLTPQYLNTVLKNALKRCGIEKNISVHGLRHTGISYFIRHGVASEVISKLAGHSEVTTTNRIYYSVIEEQKKDAFSGLYGDMIPPVSGGTIS